MKMIILILLLLTTACSFNFSKETKEDIKEQENDKMQEEIAKKPKYQDENSLKVALYQKNNNLYKKVTVFKSHLNDFKDIGVFTVILDDKEQVSGNVKELYNNVKNQYEDFSKYKIGYNINFTLKDGTVYNENILKPIDLLDYTFSDYLYIWLYDDINTNGWHSHLEEKDYNENTVMSSIKLMSTGLSREVQDGFKITVFTYDTEDDFDIDGNYRGNSKFTLTIEYEEE